MAFPKTLKLRTVYFWTHLRIWCAVAVILVHYKQIIFDFFMLNHVAKHFKSLQLSRFPAKWIPKRSLPINCLPRSSNAHLTLVVAGCCCTPFSEPTIKSSTFPKQPVSVVFGKAGITIQQFIDFAIPQHRMLRSSKKTIGTQCWFEPYRSTSFYWS